MKHAELCPVCQGKGVYYNSDLSTATARPCHGCGGKGWVEVEGEIVSIPGVWLQPIKPPIDYTITTNAPENGDILWLPGAQ